MTTRHHMCQSIRGPLKNWSSRQWADATDWITKDGGARFASADDLKAEFTRLLAEGIEVIPVGDACDNFDPVHGCRGHPLPAALAEAGL